MSFACLRSRQRPDKVAVQSNRLLLHPCVDISIFLTVVGMIRPKSSGNPPVRPTPPYGTAGSVCLQVAVSSGSFDGRPESCGRHRQLHCAPCLVFNVVSNSCIPKPSLHLVSCIQSTSFRYSFTPKLLARAMCLRFMWFPHCTSCAGIG